MATSTDSSSTRARPDKPAGNFRLIVALLAALLLLAVALIAVVQPGATPTNASVAGQQDSTPLPALKPPAYGIAVDPLLADSAVIELGISAFDPARLRRSSVYC